MSIAYKVDWTLILLLLLQRYADLHDMEFVEASAKKNTNIQEAFAKLAKEICEVKAQQQPTTITPHEADLTPSFTLGHSTIPLHDDDQQGSSCSC